MRLMIALAAVLWISGCGGKQRAGADGAPVETRDSAGIEIVESREPAWDDAARWRIDAEPLFVIHGFDTDTAGGLLDPMTVDVDRRGRVIVGDGNQVGWDAILVYDSLGRFLFRAGGNGQGPGEFGQLWWASAYREDSLVAFDMRGDRLSIFDADGRFARDVRLPQLPYEQPPRGTYGYTAGMDAAYDDGWFLAYPFGTTDVSDGPGPVWTRHWLLRLSPDGEAWDTLGDFPIMQQYWTGERAEQVWFMPVAVTATGGQDLLFGRGDRFEIARYDGHGRLTRIIRRAHEPLPVTAEWKQAFRTWYLDRLKASPEIDDEMLERITKEMETTRYADYLPPYSAMLLDDRGNLWVEEFRWLIPMEASPLNGPARWSVFDTAGVWLGDVETPPGFILKAVAGDRALGFVVDANDVKEIYAYRLLRDG